MKKELINDIFILIGGLILFYACKLLARGSFQDFVSYALLMLLIGSVRNSLKIK